MVGLLTQKIHDGGGNFLGQGGVERPAVEMQAPTVVAKVESQHIETALVKIVGGGKYIGGLSAALPAMQ